MATHKASGWKRESAGDGRGHWRITPTDGSGERIVAPMSAGSWQDYPGDDKRDMMRDRIVLLSGAPLPDWARDWLLGAWRRMLGESRAILNSALEDAADAPFRDAGW